MGAVVFVEVLDRRGRVAQRHAVEALPATVGRAYDNTIILDDLYASAIHVRLEADGNGGIVALDAGSENGLFEVGRPGRRARVAVTAGTRLRVGETVLRIALPGQAVPPALPEPLAGRLLGRVLRSPAGAVGLAVAAGISQSLSSWLRTYEQLEAARAVSDGIGVIALLAVWAGGWALATRVLTQRTLFLAHLGLVSLVAVAADAVWTLGGYVEYILPSLAEALIGDVVSVLATLVFIALLLAGHLALTSSLSPARRLAWAFGLSASLIGIVGFVSYAEDGDDEVGNAAFGGAIQPLGAAVMASDLDPFVLRLEDLRRAVDTVAARPR